MNRIRLASLAAAATLAALPALAAGQALVVLDQRADFAIDRPALVQDLLIDRLGIDSVRIAQDLTPDEVAAEVQAFLARPAAPGEYRLLWVSGLYGAQADSVCPVGEARPLPVTVPTLVLAPSCFLKLVLAPDAVRHVDIAAAAPGAPSEVTGGGAVAFVTLPGDSAAHVRAADDLLTAALDGRHGAPSPGLLLDALRYGFTADSDYTPALVASPPAAVGAALFGGEDDAPGQSFALAAERPARLSGEAPDLHRRPDGSAPAARLSTAFPVTVVRSSRDGEMAYVRTHSGHFGWVWRSSLTD